MQFLYFLRLIATEYIDLSDFFLCIFMLVVKKIICFDNSRINFDQWIFPNKRVCNRFENISWFWFCKIIVCIVYLVGLCIDSGAGTFFRTRKIFYNVDHQCIHATCKNIRTHQHRNDASIGYIDTECLADLILGELFPSKITIHKFFTRLRNSLHQCFPANTKILFGILRHFYLFHFAVIFPAFCPLL